jgi:hypothetical protein
MPKPNEPAEVAIVRYFERAPIEQAEVVFNLAAAKIRERLQEKTTRRDEKDGAKPNESRKRRPRQSPEDARSQEPQSSLETLTT